MKINSKATLGALAFAIEAAFFPEEDNRQRDRLQDLYSDLSSLKTFTPAQYEILGEAVAYYEAVLEGENEDETRNIKVLNRALDVASQLR